MHWVIYQKPLPMSPIYKIKNGIGNYWFRSYLSTRTQPVKSRKKISKTQIFFITKINDISTIANNYFLIHNAMTQFLHAPPKIVLNDFIRNIQYILAEPKDTFREQCLYYNIIYHDASSQAGD